MRKGMVNLIRRETLGMTQAQLAEVAGISAATISKHENGEEISKLHYMALNAALKEIESEMSKDQYADYFLILKAKMVREETDPEQKSVRIHDLLYAVSKSLYELELSLGKRKEKR